MKIRGIVALPPGFNKVVRIACWLYLRERLHPSQIRKESGFKSVECHFKDNFWLTVETLGELIDLVFAGGVYENQYF